ncbi:expressed unknown protein [Seminavis robusta]|uniref:FAD-dependent oxidoreductase domain-containing protein 1 n=1 Tax=Seminavis robusta TaxID=568900 RepID=A0A9N8DNE2_9STRA|nr:expressed unknown protein [Seminavis robusta]|eukprot:Sro225_g091800.1 n/a (450) ;mRNA; r:38087-39436
MTSKSPATRTGTITPPFNSDGSSSSSCSCDYEVIIVGAGVAGCSAAYHLQQYVGGNDRLLVLDAGPAAGEGVRPRQSGSATMSSVAPCVKMMVQIFAGSCQDMMRNHGKEGATRYLTATREGLVLQKTLAKEIWKDTHSLHMKELGSYYLGYEQDTEELRREFKTLLELGCGQDDMEWCDKERLQTVEGISSNFHCGIFFPKEAVIDSSLYAKTLLQLTIEKSNGKAQFWANSPVATVQEDSDAVTVTLQSGTQIRAKQVVMATGALYQDAKLNGLLKPCYSYLVHVPVNTVSTTTNSNDDCCDNSANFFTWGFSHDWCFTNGKVRISGEDHFSAYKPPHLQERCARLSHWTLEQYHHNDPQQNVHDFPQQYGLYSETPDMAPLVGRIQPNSRICYLLGCNAWGQTILSYCSSLIPGLMQYTQLTEQQQDCLKLLSIQRFSQLPAALSS